MTRLAHPHRLLAVALAFASPSLATAQVVGYGGSWRPVAPQPRVGPPRGHIGTPRCAFDPRDSLDAPEGAAPEQMRAFAERQFRSGDVAGSLRTYRRLAEMGDPQAQRSVAVALVRGVGTAADVAQGLAMLEDLARRGDAKALYHLGFFYGQRRVARLDRARSVRDYTASAERGGPWEAAFKLGFAYELGEGVGRDHAAGLRWFDRAAAETNEQTPALYAAFLRKSGGRRFASGQALADAWFANYVRTHTPRYVAACTRAGRSYLTATACGGIYAPSACGNPSYRDLYAHRNDNP